MVKCIFSIFLKKISINISFRHRETMSAEDTIVNLHRMFQIQKKLIDTIKKDKPEFFQDPEPFSGYRLFMLSSFLQHEAEELKMETKWKWWKAQENYKIDMENRKVEIADMWHVLIQISIEAGMDANDVFNSFYRKHQENLQRQENRY